MEQRKKDYWRGFKACAIISGFIAVVWFVVWANLFISNDDNMRKMQLCNALNNGDYEATQNCFYDN